MENAAEEDRAGGDGMVNTKDKLFGNWRISAGAFRWDIDGGCRVEFLPGIKTHFIWGDHRYYWFEIEVHWLLWYAWVDIKKNRGRK